MVTDGAMDIILYDIRLFFSSIQLKIEISYDMVLHHIY